MCIFFHTEPLESRLLQTHMYLNKSKWHSNLQLVLSIWLMPTQLSLMNTFVFPQHNTGHTPVFTMGGQSMMEGSATRPHYVKNISQLV